MKRSLYSIKRPSMTIFEHICDIDNLRLAHQNAKRGKGWYKEVIEIEKDVDKYLYQLRNMLINKTYRTSKYEIFTKKDSGKERIIYKLPYFPDRIAQWAIMQVIEPFLLRQFIKNTYSAIPNRGIHNCLKDLHNALNKDPKGTQYCLKLDIQKFYPSINHDILKDKYRHIFKDNDLLWLLDEIIDSVPDEDGIPIGNYLSQYSGNFYVSSLDHWLKEVKGVKYYFRYMDDMVILGSSKKELHKLRKDIEEYCRVKLKLKLKRNYQVFPTAIRGIDFVGYRSFYGYTLLRKSTCKRYKRKFSYIKKMMDKGASLDYSNWCSINSYNGLLLYCDSYRLQTKYYKPIETYAKGYYETQIKNKSKKV